jgi:hypothetical protein
MGYDDEFEDDYAGDDYHVEEIRYAVADLIDEEAPGLSLEARAASINSLAELFAEGEHFTVEPDGPYEEGEMPSPGFVPTQVGRELVRQQAAAFRAARRSLAPAVASVWGRSRTSCRPLRAARRVRRYPTARTRGSPSRSDDPEPEPPGDRACAPALRAVAQ